MKNKIQFKGVKFLIIVILSYIVLSFFDLNGAINSFSASLKVLGDIWPLFLFIIALTTAINYFLNPKLIRKHIGADSGIKGIFYALIGGIISHGPMYAWYGLLEELREKGAKDELLIIFLYARAIKIPMIPFSIAIFGTLFTILISIYILLLAILQGKLYNYLNNKLS